jgi:hypothetical protein
MISVKEDPKTFQFFSPPSKRIISVLYSLTDATLLHALDFIKHHLLNKRVLVFVFPSICFLPLPKASRHLSKYRYNYAT